MASTRIDAPDARRIAAVLANDDMRTLYATIVLGQDSTLPAATAKKALAALLRSGLVQQVVEEGDDSHPGDGHRVVASPQVFRELLAQHPPRVIATGVEKYLRDGKIDRYPAAAHERHELLVWVVERAIGVDEVLSERDVNERLEPFTDDVAALRRYLVDAALLERTPSGSTYARVVD